MNAVVFRRHGGPEVLEWAQMPMPAPGPDEAVVAVKACGLNHLDIWTREGMPGVTISMPHILGCDVAGTIHALGAPSDTWRTGQSVVVAPGISCGTCSECRAGRDSRCATFQIVGFQEHGGYAQFVKVPLRNLIPITTDGWSYAHWAAVPLVSLTAWHMLMTRGQLQPGETALIHAAGSGVGSAAIQIAKWRGATVLTTVGDPAKEPKARALGADHVINYRATDFAGEALAFTRDRGVDLVLEHIGPATWAGSLRALARGGRLVTCGATSGPEVSMSLRFVFAKELSILGCYMGGRRELDEVLKLVAQGVVKPVVDTVLPLREAAKAHALMGSRHHFGKLVLAL
ncbi:MAG: zinc-binding dehydrogenase [Candidatus Omnitrophica bacterium]|nr:zinc-binding dehydrogenase [Candidatus Omnitrophota bacterium]